MKRFIALALPVLLLAACGDSVPKVEDPHNIVVDGQPMTQAAFIQKYCAGKSDNETCMKVLAAKNHDATRGKTKVQW